MLTSLVNTMLHTVMTLMKSPSDLITVYPKVARFLGVEVLRERCVKLLLSSGKPINIDHSQIRSFL